MMQPKGLSAEELEKPEPPREKESLYLKKLYKELPPKIVSIIPKDQVMLILFLYCHTAFNSV